MKKRTGTEENLLSYCTLSLGKIAIYTVFFTIYLFGRSLQDSFRDATLVSSRHLLLN